MRRPPITRSGPRPCHGGSAHQLPAASAVLIACALAGCSSFSSAPPKSVDPNIFPANYKASLMTYLQANPFGLVGATSAELSAPVLKPFGSESRYVACLRVAGPNLRREKMVVYYGGELNQFVDATEEGCRDAAYAPFPELPALLAQLRSKQK